MPYIQFKDEQYALSPTDLTVGAFDGAAVRLPGDDRRAHAVLKLGADGTGIIRRGADDAVVLLNGLQLGAEPRPILHGDKVEVGGLALRYGDDKKGGSTQFITAASLPESLRPKAGAPRRPTTATGGRLVSLVDGREYGVPDAGVTFGREIGCDIVIPSTDVSRRHAGIAPAEGAYLLTDMSTNGVFVNGTRVEKSQVLGRGDVVKIGPEEFRFYADVAKQSAPAASAPPSTPAEKASSAPAAATPAPPVPALPATPMDVPSLSNTGYMPRIQPPSPPVAASAPPLPDFELELVTAMDAVTPQPVAAPKAPPSAPPAAAAPPAPPAKAPAAPPSPPAKAPAAPPAPRVSVTTPPSVARVSASTPTERKPIATLEVTNPGPTKGTKYDLF